MTLLLQYSAVSNRGLVRTNNEDSGYAGPRLLALADGMGGHAAGEVASRLVIDNLAPLDLDERRGDLLDALALAIQHGNAAIGDQVAASPELEGMGTTLTAILFAGSRLALCHVGDSRGYLYREGQLTQITRDDTFVQTLVDEGRITAEQAHSHPQRSLIMKALTGQDVEPTLTIREARAGDRYLLCSDGLSDVVSNETIGDTLGSIASHRECTERLVELALRSGGPDNITVVVADVLDTDYGDTHPIVVGAAGNPDTDGDSPDPNTAAGRAAALRPQPERVPAAPVDADDAPPARPRRRWRAPLIALLAVVVVVAAALALTSLLFRDSYFLKSGDDGVEIYRGSPDRLLTFTQKETDQICVTEADTDSPAVTVRELGDDATCDPLRVDDLEPASQNNVLEFTKNVTDRENLVSAVEGVKFLPLCTSEERPDGETDGTAATGDVPAPVPATGETSPVTGSPTDPQPENPGADDPEATPEGGIGATGEKTATPTETDSNDKPCRVP